MYKYVLVLAIAIFCCGCTHNVLILSKSPDGSSVVKIHETCGLADCEVEVTKQNGWFGNEVEIAKQSDCATRFAHVAWSPDSRRVVVYAENGIAPDILVAYDLVLERKIPFESMVSVMQNSLRREYEYAMPEYHEPASWQYVPSQLSDAFQKRHRR